MSLQSKQKSVLGVKPTQPLLSILHNGGCCPWSEVKTISSTSIYVSIHHFYIYPPWMVTRYSSPWLHFFPKKQTVSGGQALVEEKYLPSFTSVEYVRSFFWYCASLCRLYWQDGYICINILNALCHCIGFVWPGFGSRMLQGWLLWEVSRSFSQQSWC